MQALRDAALAYPETTEDFPWGHSAFKVRGKSFAFVVCDGEGFRVSTKLPSSSSVVLNFPFASPTGYGLGKSGWVTASFARKDKVPVGMLVEWMDESYRARAPKRLIKQLEALSR
jgi:predicted DNA-binding protein (MmcQ/YjbR family)